MLSATLFRGGTKREITMTMIRKIILICTAAFLLAMLLYPPFLFEGGGTKFNLGYGFIFSPPKMEGTDLKGHMDAATLALQLFVIVFCGGVLYVLTGKKKSNY